MTLLDPMKSTFPPTFLIIGAQKCGTTALYTYLSKHPEIIPSEQKELHFFDCDNRYARGEIFYHGLFPAVSPHQLTFDASAGYLMNHKAPARIHAYDPKVKLIALLRNPVDRAYSAWQMYKRRYEVNRDWFFSGWVHFCNNDLNIKKRNEDRIFNFHSYIKEDIASEEEQSVIESPVINHGRYAEQLERYFKFFDKEQIMVIESDMLRTQTKNVLNNIQDFLGIEYCDFISGELDPVFEGEYTEKMEDRTRSFLNSYYKPYNEKLFSLLKTHYSW